MSNELERRDSLQKGGSGHDVEPVMPAMPQQVFALVIDYTNMTIEDLSNVRTLIGGGNGPVIKLDPALLRSEETGRSALLQLTQALHYYPCNMLFLLVPWGMSNIELVIKIATQLTGQKPFVVFAIGRELYSVELTMTVDPLSMDDAELRQDPEFNGAEMQWAVRQPWVGKDISGVIAELQKEI